jgi:hypothetical protein
MEKLNTIQKRNKLNEVYRTGDVGPGGAYHDYMIEQKIPVDFPGLLGESHYTNIPFQRGARNEYGSRHGVLDVDLLEIVRDRLMCFQNGDYACRENAIALTHIEEALLWLNKRVEDRAERGVLGTEEK